MSFHTEVIESSKRSHCSSIPFHHNDKTSRTVTIIDLEPKHKKLKVTGTESESSTQIEAQTENSGPPHIAKGNVGLNDAENKITQNDCHDGDGHSDVSKLKTKMSCATASHQHPKTKVDHKTELEINEHARLYSHSKPAETANVDLLQHSPAGQSVNKTNTISKRVGLKDQVSVDPESLAVGHSDGGCQIRKNVNSGMQLDSFSMPPTPPSSGEKVSKVSLLSTSISNATCLNSDQPKTNHNVLLMLTKALPLVPAYSVLSKDTGSKGQSAMTKTMDKYNQPVIEVMCDLPAQSNPTFSPSINNIEPVSIAMKTQAVKVILASSKSRNDTQGENDPIGTENKCINSKHHSTEVFQENANSANCSVIAHNLDVSPSKKLTGTSGNCKIGRPKKSEVQILQAEGEVSSSKMKCLICKRVFPRIKSLEAHMRIHTGEKPYCCDFPHCNRSFNQSGQLRTHHRLHTGEKPFKCGNDDCNNMYAHANRSCPLHPKATLKRHSVAVIQTSIDAFPNKDEVAKWFYRYGRDHHIEVDILNYNNPTLKAEIIAELVIPRKTDVDISYGFDEPLQKPAECNIIVRNKKRRKPGKESEIQGALALMELARN